MKRNALNLLATCLVAVSWTPVTEAAGSKPFVQDELQQFTATVEDVDQQNRTVVLLAPDGNRAIFSVGSEVRNFAQVKKGDRVVLSYYVGVAAEIKPHQKKGEGSTEPEETVLSARAPAGERPAAAVSQSVTTTVQIEAVDTSFNTVTFKRPDGIVRTIAVNSPDAQKFLRTLKPGDAVEITYTEATAVSVEPASG